MKYIGIALLIAAGFALLTLGLAFLLFRLAFGARKTTEKEMFVLPGHGSVPALCGGGAAHDPRGPRPSL